MASFYTKDNYLYLDFRWRGVRCQEATRLVDTTDNRAKVRRDIRQIDGEIAGGTFEYLRWFPHGRKAALFAPTESTEPPLYREYVERWLRQPALAPERPMIGGASWRVDSSPPSAGAPCQRSTSRPLRASSPS